MPSCARLSQSLAHDFLTKALLFDNAFDAGPRAGSSPVATDLAKPALVLEASPTEVVSAFTHDDRDTVRRAITVASVCLLLLLIVRCGWCSDDAFHTLRALKLWREHHGLSSNPGVRVQSFTHPLFALIELWPFALANNPFNVALAIDVIASAGAAVLLAFSIGRGSWAAALGITVLCFSKAFLDYSTAGLENPVSHLLLALFIDSYCRGSRRWLWVWGGLLGLNRLDALLVAAPAMADVLVRGRPWAQMKWTVLGFLPLFFWEAFSIVYYGFPFPNTAFAKLNTDIPALDLAMQGLTYLDDSLHRDPVTLLTITGVFVVLSCRRPPNREALAILAGVSLYLAYVVRIGGDFMSGRFLTVPLFACVAVFVARTPSWLTPRRVAATAAIFGLLVVQAPYSPFRDLSVPCNTTETGVVDERACYETQTSLLRNLRRAVYRSHDYYVRGTELAKGTERVVVESAVGMTTYAAGPAVTFVDTFGIDDAFLAHIPYRPGPDWRIGHFVRPVPAGYVETVRTGENKIEDRCLREYYDVLRAVITGPLFTAARWKAIVGLNFGTYDALARGECSP